MEPVVPRGNWASAEPMLGLPRLLEWFRKSGPWRATIGRLARASPRGQIVIWIFACCVPLALLGAVQMAWIGHVSESQRNVALTSLGESLRLVANQIEYETKLLLMTFSPDADIDRDRRLERYLQRYLSWNELSLHGPVLDRILFQQTTAMGSESLSELNGPSRRIDAASWGDRLEPLRRHIQRIRIEYGPAINSRWLSTWMFHPEAIAVFRPIGNTVAQPRGDNLFSVAGWLILQLDLAAIRDQLIPEILNDHFGSSGVNDRYAVSISLDGSSLYAYEPARGAGGRPGEDRSAGNGYLLRPAHIGGGAGWVEFADLDQRLLLSPAPVQNLATRRGGVQRVSLRDPVDLSRLRRATQDQSVSIREGDLKGSRLDFEGDASFEIWSSPPRLFVIADQQRRLSLEARHVEMPFEEAMSLQYRRSLVLGMGLLVLLAGAVAIVTATGRSAARLAEARMEAATSQSHQLRTPLAVILVLADNMARGMLGPGEKVIQYGGLIREYGQRLSQIVDRTMQLSAIDSFEERYSLTMLDVSRVATDALEEARPLIDGAGFVAESSNAEDLPMVRADPEALRQSVVDLLSNAVKYGLPGRWLKIETAEAPSGRGREVQIRVHDRGSGIPSSEADKIFEPYYRVANDANSSIPGTGLGLNLVRERIKAMGGKLTLETEEGRGSVFTIHLPVAA